MDRRLFFLRQDGWFEAEITGKLLQATDAELLRWAYTVTERNGYRNYLLTENPGTHVQMCKCADVQMCKCADVQMKTA